MRQSITRWFIRLSPCACSTKLIADGGKGGNGSISGVAKDNIFALKKLAAEDEVSDTKEGGITGFKCIWIDTNMSVHAYAQVSVCFSLF